MNEYHSAGRFCDECYYSSHQAVLRLLSREATLRFVRNMMALNVLFFVLQYTRNAGIVNAYCNFSDTMVFMLIPTAVFVSYRMFRIESRPRLLSINSNRLIINNSTHFAFHDDEQQKTTSPANKLNSRSFCKKLELPSHILVAAIHVRQPHPPCPFVTTFTINFHHYPFLQHHFLHLHLE
jgi:hypothetical protein